MPPESVPMNRSEIRSEAEIEALTRNVLGRVPVLRQRLQELGSTPSIDPGSIAGSTNVIPSDITSGSMRSRLLVRPTT